MPVRLEGVTAVAALLIASFAIERISAGVLFVLSFIRGWNNRFPDPATVADPAARYHAERKMKIVRFVLAALIGLPLLAWYGKVQILGAVGFAGIDPDLDRLLTGVILVGGADRIAEVLKWAGAEAHGTKGLPAATSGAHAVSEPLEVTGKLTLELKETGVGPTGLRNVS